MVQPHRKSRRAPWRGVVAAIVALGVVAGWTGWHERRAQARPLPAAEDAAPVTLALATRADVPEYLVGVGNVQPQASVTVKPRIDDQLDAVTFVEGQRVAKGQVLALLDPRALRAQREQARAQQAKDAAQLVNAKRDLQRDVELVRSDGVTQQALDTQRALVAQLEAAVQADAAQVDYASVQLGYATIRAPISGIAGARLVDPGNIVHASDPGGIVVINRIDPIDVTFSLPGDTVQAINARRAEGHRLPVLVSGRGEGRVLARGELVLVNNQIDETSGTVQLKARFANPAHALWPGQFVDVRLLLRTFHDACTVPAAAVLRGQQGTYVDVVGRDRRAHAQAVVVRQIQDGTAVIAHGLQPGAEVVMDGQYKVRSGGLVRVVKQVAKQVAAASEVAP